MPKTYIIAEAGVNHNGQYPLALDMIHQAKAVGADAIKFQLFSADKLTTRDAKQAEYQKAAHGEMSQYDMLKSLELAPAHFIALKDAALNAKVDFIITPFDLDSLAFIGQDLALPLIKLGSGDITNGPLLLNAASYQRKIIISSGMATLSEVEDALRVLAFGLLYPNQIPDQQALHETYISEAGQLALKQYISILHCTSEYPAPSNEVNLKAMDTLASAFGLPVGLSDHTRGINVALAAVAREAHIIEKHFTLDNQMAGPDHQASLNPHNLKLMIDGIREVESALGHGRKIPSVSERKNMGIVRRSLVANQPIKAGQPFNADNIGIKRPQKGLSPMHYWDVLGKVATKDYDTDEVLS